MEGPIKCDARRHFMHETGPIKCYLDNGDNPNTEGIKASEADTYFWPDGSAEYLDKKRKLYLIG